MVLLLARQAIASLSSATHIPDASRILAPFAFGAAIQVRNSTKRGGGSTKNNRNSAGKRLGVKRSGGQYVNAGEIIMRQRGKNWHAGENVKMGRDHTLFAVEPGYVHYYRPNPLPVIASDSTQASGSGLASGSASASGSGTIDSVSAKLAGLQISPLAKIQVQPHRELVKPHPSASLLKRKMGRRYIGVTLTREETLPREIDAPRVRRLALVDWAREQRLAQTLRETETDYETTAASSLADGAVTDLREETRSDGVSQVSPV